MEIGRSFNVLCQPADSEANSKNSSQSDVDSERDSDINAYNDSDPTDELARAKQAINAWKTKADSMQKRNELLETEILILRNAHSVTNGDAEVSEEEDDETGQLPSRTDELQLLEDELQETKEQLSETTELYEELLRQRNSEMRLRRYSTVENQSTKAKVVELEVQVEKLKVKHKEDLLQKDDDLKVVEERADRAKAKALMLRKELEEVKTDKSNIQIEKTKLERKLRKVYSAKQQWREQTEDSIKHMEVSTLKLRNSRLQIELQRAYSSPSPQCSLYGSQESLLELGSKVTYSVTSPPMDSPTVDEGDVFPSGIGSKERELETEVDSLKEEIQMLQEQLSTESKQNETIMEKWEQQYADSEEKVTALQTELCKSKEEISALSEQLEVAKTTVEELDVRLHKNEAEFTEKLRQKEEDLSETSKALVEAKEELRNVPSDVVSLQQHAKKLKQQLDETKKKLEETKQQLDKEIVAVSWKNQEITELRNKLQ